MPLPQLARPNSSLRPQQQRSIVPHRTRCPRTYALVVRFSPTLHKPPAPAVRATVIYTDSSVITRLVHRYFLRRCFYMPDRRPFQACQPVRAYIAIPLSRYHAIATLSRYHAIATLHATMQSQRFHATMQSQRMSATIPYDRSIVHYGLYL